MPSAAGKAPAPTRFGAPLPRFRGSGRHPLAAAPTAVSTPCLGGRQHRQGAAKAPKAEPVAAKSGAPSKVTASAALSGADGLARGDSPLRARLAAMEMEIEALKRGSDGGASVGDGGQASADWAAALKEQTEALTCK